MTTTLTRRYCEDCKFHATTKALGETFHQCHAPQNERPSGMGLVVRNGTDTEWMCETAAIQRKSTLDEYCGVDGKWFVPRKAALVAA